MISQLELQFSFFDYLMSLPVNPVRDETLRTRPVIVISKRKR